MRGEGEAPPSVRERERGEGDTAAGLVGLSLRKPAKCKRLTDKTRGQSLSAFRYRAQTVVSQPLNAGSRRLTPTRPCRCIPLPPLPFPHPLRTHRSCITCIHGADKTKKQIVLLSHHSFFW